MSRTETAATNAAYRTTGERSASDRGRLGEVSSSLGAVSRPDAYFGPAGTLGAGGGRSPATKVSFAPHSLQSVPGTVVNQLCLQAVQETRFMAESRRCRYAIVGPSVGQRRPYCNARPAARSLY